VEENREVALLGGLHDVRLALKSRPREVLHVWVDSRRADRRVAEIVTLAAEQGVAVSRITRREIDEKSGGIRHQGVLAQCPPARTTPGASLESLLDGLPHPPFLLILDGVQDPHNLGACLRTADAAGVDAVVVPQDRACAITPVVSRVAAGATHSLPFFAVTNLVRTLEMLKQRGIWITGATDDANQSLWACDLTGPVALVLGAEGTGLRELTRRHCDHLASIPMLGSVESLNVSVATGVMLYEARRQRG
jgi:23S rRNA (guanosine2251-2'-O)-methyltransferase